jgi:uncharacterized membrane protein YjjB (DUF3815 family)
MIAYRPAPTQYQYHPRLAQVVVPAAAPVVSAGPTGSAFPEGLLWTALAAAAAWASYQTTQNTTGFKQVAAWAGTLAAGLAAVTGITGLVAPSVARGLPLRWYYV